MTIEQILLIAAAVLTATFAVGTCLSEVGRLIVGKFPRAGEAMIRAGSDLRGFVQALRQPAGTASVSAPRIDEAAPAIAHAQVKGYVPSSPASPAVVAATIAQGKVDAAEAKKDEPPPRPPLPPIKPPSPPALGGGAALCLALMLGGCASPLQVGASINNVTAGLLNESAPRIREKCVDGMAKVQTKEALDALDEVCEPATLAYDAALSAQLSLYAALYAAAGGDTSKLGAAIAKMIEVGRDLAGKMGAVK